MSKYSRIEYYSPCKNTSNYYHLLNTLLVENPGSSSFEYVRKIFVIHPKNYKFLSFLERNYQDSIEIKDIVYFILNDDFHTMRRFLE